MMVPIDDMMLMPPHLMGCCSLINVMPWLIAMVVLTILTVAITDFLVKRFKSSRQSEALPIADF